VKEIVDLLRTIDPFSQLADADLDGLARRAELVEVPAGNPLFSQGDAGDRAYVIQEGQLEVTAPGPWQPIVLAVCGPGDMVGEAALLRGTTRNATVTARTDSTLIAVGPDDLKAAVGSGAGALMQTILDRWDSTRDHVMRAERMAQLGTLAAGVAHELNNPAAAIQRSAEILSETLDRLDRAGVALSRHAFDAAGEDLLGEILASTARAASRAMSPMDRMEAEESIRNRLEEAGVADAGPLAGDAIATGIDRELVERVVSAWAGDEAGAVVELVVASASAKQLAAEIGWASGHMAEIARDLGQYSRLGEAPVQDVDIVEGLERTLRLVAHRLEGIEVVRQFESDLPLVPGAGSELNQVWTNLVANAADAAGTGGTVTVRAFAVDESVVVEVQDDGPGIEAENLPRIFDPFFTTKPPGSGTGLGLPIANRIIVVDHRGDLTVDSAPGSTVFRVVLPLHPGG